jgi:hypothetical protein
LNKNLKTSLLVLIAFVIAIVVVIAALHNLEPQLVSLEHQRNFYNQNFEPEKKKIFLIGSSEVHRLNATFIENYISQHVDNYEVYNLSIHSDLPQRRLASIDMILANEPEIVVYGTGFREYHIPRTSEKISSLPEAYLPAPLNTLQIFESIDSSVPYDFSKLQSPKLHILRFIRDSLELRTPEVTPDMIKTDTPFMKYNENMYSISTNKELEIFYQQPGREWPGIKDPKSDKTSSSLDEIISILKQNDIQVILFSNPSNTYELETVGNRDIGIFVQNLKEISERNDIKLYLLHEKYSNLPIFNAGNHVSMDTSALIYSEDIAKTILNEIES